MSVILFEQYQSPYGELKIGSFEERLCLCDWNYRKMRKAVDERICKALATEMKPGKSDVIELCKEQLEAYFNKQRTDFSIPLLLSGSEFQKRVWQHLIEIPYGKMTSYLELSRKLGDEKAIRAVASANGANAHSIIIPCHRVIGSGGELTGYAGGLTAKRKLLELENSSQASQMELF